MQLGTPLTSVATRALLLGSGELGKEITIELQRLGVEVIACDKYANAPAMQVVAVFKDMVFKTVIARNVRLSEAPSHGQAAISYDVASNGAQNYLNLAQEVLSRNADKGGK